MKISQAKLVRYFQVIIVFGAALACLVPLMGRIVLNGTPSVPANILWKTPSLSIGKGDYVMAPARHEYIPPQYPYLTKRALCLPGETLSFVDGSFLCDGILLNTTKPETLTGAPLTPFQWRTGPVPEGFAFVGSDHPDGFDSRYLGLFPLEDLVRLEPLL